jgi:hypothetical protein
MLMSQDALLYLENLPEAVRHTANDASETAGSSQGAVASPNHSSETHIDPKPRRCIKTCSTVPAVRCRPEGEGERAT